MKTVLEELRTEHEQILRIQAIPVFAQYHVPELLARFKAQYPQIKVQITETEKKQLEKNLEEGSCDVIYTREILAEEKKQDGAVTKVDGLLAEIAGMQEKEIREGMSEFVYRKSSRLARELPDEIWHVIKASQGKNEEYIQKAINEITMNKVSGICGEVQDEYQLKMKEITDDL